MKLTIEPSVFNKVLKTVQPAISSNPSIPILENVKCVLNGDKLEVYGTNLNLSIAIDVACKSKDEGVFLLPFKKLYSIVSLAASPIEINVGKEIEIKINKEKFKIGVPVDAVNYPEAAEPEFVVSFPVNSDFISNMKSATKFTTTDKSGYDAFSGICIDVKLDKVGVVSSDRNGFFYFEDKIKNNNELKVLTDAMFINSLPMIEDAEISISEKFIRFSNDSIRIHGTLSEQKFFNYQQTLITHTTNCTINRSALLDSLNKIMAIKVISTIIKISFLDGAMVIDFNESEFNSEYTNTIPCTHSVELKGIMLGAGILRNLIQEMPNEEYVKLTFGKNEKTQVYLDSEEGKNICFIAPVVYSNN